MLESKHAAEPWVAPQVGKVGLPGIGRNLSLWGSGVSGGRARYPRNIGTSSYLGADNGIGFEFFVSISDSIPIDTKSLGKIAARRQPVAQLERSARDHLSHPKHDLGVEWHVTIPIKLEYQRTVPP